MWFPPNSSPRPTTFLCSTSSLPFPVSLLCFSSPSEWPEANPRSLLRILLPSHRWTSFQVQIRYYIQAFKGRPKRGLSQISVSTPFKNKLNVLLNFRPDVVHAKQAIPDSVRGSRRRNRHVQLSVFHHYGMHYFAAFSNIFFSTLMRFAQVLHSQELLCPSGYGNKFAGLCAALMIIGGVVGAFTSG